MTNDRPVRPAQARAVWDVVRRSRVVLAGSCSVKGRPFCTPVWFVVDRHAVYLTTGGGSWLGRNVLANPEVTLLFGGEAAGSAGAFVQVRGTATIHEGMVPARLLAALALKYYVPPRAATSELSHLRQWPVRGRYYRQAPGPVGYVRVVPTSARLLHVG